MISFILRHAFIRSQLHISIRDTQNQNRQEVFASLAYCYQMGTCDVSKPGSLVYHHMYILGFDKLKLRMAKLAERKLGSNTIYR